MLATIDMLKIAHLRTKGKCFTCMGEGMKFGASCEPHTLPYLLNPRVAMPLKACTNNFGWRSLKMRSSGHLWGLLTSPWRK